jgi:hypothetical protein
MNTEEEKRLAELEERVLFLEKAQGKNVAEIELTLPEKKIGGLYFNAQRVSSVFERMDDGAYYSQDILFMSARNSADDNSKDLLTWYLNRAMEDGNIITHNIKEQIAHIMKIEDANRVELFLPEKPIGIKKYHGVNWWYWLAGRKFAARFCTAFGKGRANCIAASALGGVAPAFRIKTMMEGAGSGA